MGTWRNLRKVNRKGVRKHKMVGPQPLIIIILISIVVVLKLLFPIIINKSKVRKPNLLAMTNKNKERKISIKKQQTGLRPVERKNEKLKQNGYFACM